MLKKIDDDYFTQYAQVTKKCEEIINNIIHPGMSGKEKEKAVHDYLIANSTYLEDNLEESHTPIGILINKHGVCDSYAKSTALLMNLAGVECIIIESVKNTDGHAWNIVKINGKYYHLDVTYDHVKNYEYFNLSDRQIAKDHVSTPIINRKCEVDNPDVSE